MHDNREQIPQGTKIPSSGTMSGTIFTVTDLVGRGGSCMVYNAFSIDRFGIRHEYILKQLFPLPPESGGLVHWNSVRVSEAELKRFMKASAIQQKFSRMMVNTTPVIHSVFSYEDIVYFQCLERNFGVSLDKMHFDSMYTFVDALIKAAEIISAYHREGWLHLDIKPQNLFCKTNDENTSVIMIDFDSLIRIEDVSDTSITLSYSQGYAPPELIHNKRNQIGIKSDFYEIGCILFEKLFGRSPRSAEISGFTKYRFSESILNDAPKNLIDVMTRFFRHTLTVRPSDRYDNDEAFIAELREIKHLSRESSRKIISNFTTPSVFFVGREQEIDSIYTLLQKQGKVIVQGVGGIGKSSVALQYAERHRNDYHTILHLEYHGSFEEIIDEEIRIDELPDDTSRSEKWNLFRSLCNEKTLVILDNLEQTDNGLEKDWLTLPCHLIVTTRSNQEQFRDITIQLSGLREAKELFCHYYTYPLSDVENNLVNQLLYTIGSHAMMTELLSKYCVNSRTQKGGIDFQKLLEAFDRADTAKVETDGVKQFKDWTLRNRSIQSHMDVLFSIFSFSEEEIFILQFISLIPLKSISEKLFLTWCHNYSQIALESLKGRGIIQNDIQGYLKLHPLTAERVLSNYPPNAEVFSYTTEKISDAISEVNHNTSETLLRIGTFYADHLKGESMSLAFLYQTLALNISTDLEELYTEKAKKMFALVMKGNMPLYYTLKPLVTQYLSLDTFGDFEQKAELIREIMSILDGITDRIPEYRKANQCEQIAALCHLIATTDMFWMFGEDDEELDHPLYIYEATILETALQCSQSNTDRKRIAKALYNLYSDCTTPFQDLVKETKYYQIAELDADLPQFYRLNNQTGKYEPVIKPDGEQDERLINALIVEKQYDKALELADHWYERLDNSSATCSSFLMFLIRDLYWTVGQLTKYIHIAEIENSQAGNYMDLKLVEAYWENENYEKCYAYLKNAETYYSPSFCNALDYKSISYLLALICLTFYFPDEKSDAEEKFLSNAELFYHYSLFVRDNNIAELCLKLSKKYFEASETEYASRYLGLYVRFQETSHIEDPIFQVLLSQVTVSGCASVWYKMMIIDSLGGESSSEAINQYEELLMKPEIDEFYKQFIYSKMIDLNRDYVTQHYANNINYEMLDEMKLQASRDPLSFDEKIRHRIDIAEAYENIGVKCSERILEQLLSEIRAFSGDDRMKSKALRYLERYYVKRGNINFALELAMECIDFYRHDLNDFVRICLDISDYYSNLNDSNKQLAWINKALFAIKYIDSNRSDYYDLMTTIHSKFLTYYISKDDEINQIQEYQELIILEKNSPYSINMKRLQGYYHALSKLFLNQHNPIQAYYYSTLEEEIVQDRVYDSITE